MKAIAQEKIKTLCLKNNLALIKKVDFLSRPFWRKSSSGNWTRTNVRQGGYELSINSLFMNLRGLRNLYIMGCVQKRVQFRVHSINTYLNCNIENICQLQRPHCSLNHKYQKVINNVAAIIQTISNYFEKRVTPTIRANEKIAPV
ncbi:hypothetical protein AEQU3_02894 [Aequorivita antarctica]|nr:hypothetical protein AEQU3_02894 [Aequorivita antarctica]